MGLNKTVGILSDVTKDTDKNTYSLNVTVNKDESTGKKLDAFTKVTKDYSALKYQKVKVLYKEKDNVFGVYSMTDDNTVVSNVMDNVKMDSNKLKINGTKYSIASDSTVYVDGDKMYTTDTVSYTHLQNARKWADSTCRAYDSVFYHYIAEIYNDIEYASLTEETAEQIWSSKIDIFEGSDAQDQRARSIFVSFVEQACRAGLSSMRFRDLAPFVIPTDLNQLTVEQLLAVRKAAELCKWRPKSLTIEAEIKIYNELIKRASTQGECITCLLYTSTTLPLGAINGIIYL